MCLSFPLSCIPRYVFIVCFLMVEPRANQEGCVEVAAESVPFTAPQWEPLLASSLTSCAFGEVLTQLPRPQFPHLEL